MKYTLILITALLAFSCKEAPKEEQLTNTMAKAEMVTETVTYPEALEKIFEAHGGLTNWKAKQTLSYDMARGKKLENQVTDLYSRKDKISGDGFALGFDGSGVWLMSEGDQYKGDPVFYHNLMFYFYAMPFVLADDGIVYSETTNLEFEGKSYPGIGIGYNAGVGTSPKDEYFIHYDPETYQMAWLGYTVTYFSGEKSEKVNWRRYNDWKTFNGLKLPNSMSGCKSEDGKITEIGKASVFTNVKVSEKPFDEGTLAMPEGAKVVE